MRIEGTVWLEDIAEKLWRKHRVAEVEVEEILQNHPRFRFVENGHRAGENVYAAMGRTDGGRLLIVFFVHKEDADALIVSAREMTPAERKKYERK